MASDSRGKALYADIGSVPNVPEREGDRRLPGAARRAHLRRPRAADPRRLALGVRAGDRPRLGRARDLRPLEPAVRCSAATTSPTPTTPTGSPTPRSRSRASPGSSATSSTERSLRERLGLKMIEQRLAGTDGYAGDKFTVNRLRRIQSNDRLYGAELFRSTLAAFCHANPTLVNSDGAAVDVERRLPGARRLRRAPEPRQHRGDPLPALVLEPRHAAVSRRRSTSPTRSTRRPGSTPPTRRWARRSPTRSPTSTTPESRSTPRSASTSTSRAAPRTSRSTAAPAARARST